LILNNRKTSGYRLLHQKQRELVRNALFLVHEKRIQGEQSGTFALEVLHFRFFLINYSGVFAARKLIGGGCFDALRRGDFWEVWHGFFSFRGYFLIVRQWSLIICKPPAATCGGADARFSLAGGSWIPTQESVKLIQG